MNQPTLLIHSWGLSHLSAYLKKEHFRQPWTARPRKALAIVPSFKMRCCWTSRPFNHHNAVAQVTQYHTLVYSPFPRMAEAHLSVFVRSTNFSSIYDALCSFLSFLVIHISFQFNQAISLLTSSCEPTFYSTCLYSTFSNECRRS